MKIQKSLASHTLKKPWKMSCTELSQVISCTSAGQTTPNFTREGSSDTPMRMRRKRRSGSAATGIVTLNVYATKVCLRFPSSPSPPALFYATTPSPIHSGWKSFKKSHFNKKKIWKNYSKIAIFCPKNEVLVQKLKFQNAIFWRIFTHCANFWRWKK